MTMNPSAPDSPVSPAPVSLYDARPFFEKALQFGMQNGIIDSAKLDAIRLDAPKGMVQIARYFGNENLRPDIEKARDRIVNLVSLYLQATSGGDLRQAAESLRDHSFLSRSKGGSDMLKALLALPESTGFHASLESSLDAAGPPKGLAEWSLKSLADYQAELARRLPIQQEKDAAVWLAEHLGLDALALEDAHTHAEAVIRSALLALATRRTEFPDWVEFEKMVADLRKKYQAARARSEVKTQKAASARAQTLSVTIPQDLPDELRGVVQAVRKSVLADLPQILDGALPCRALFANDSEHHHAPLLGRYFWVEDIASEMHYHEQSVSTAWDKVTGGNCDDGSLLTLLVCVAAAAAPKTVMSEKTAAALVRKMQKPGPPPGFRPELASQYIVDHAPAEHQDAYLALWEDFVEEAGATLQSDSTYARKDALALLRRECHVIA
ncbi:hypothetical protein [Polaromonas glacialis]|uniref:hypothetical protein n=1 Tax=Polaromonas glacialis TaxID=866564 RepID=UPI000494E29F|nr:hypothetical protein [Polaromonas glacialis]